MYHSLLCISYSISRKPKGRNNVFNHPFCHHYLHHQGFEVYAQACLFLPSICHILLSNWYFEPSWTQHFPKPWYVLQLWPLTSFQAQNLMIFEESSLERFRDFILQFCELKIPRQQKNCSLLELNVEFQGELVLKNTKLFGEKIFFYILRTFSKLIFLFKLHF